MIPKEWIVEYNQAETPFSKAEVLLRFCIKAELSVTAFMKAIQDEGLTDVEKVRLLDMATDAGMKVKPSVPENYYDETDTL